MIHVDGSIGEGGGQILRTALALSAVSGKPIKIYNIRAKRSNPGLQRQHLMGVRAVAELSRARVRGAELGSTVLEFEPGGLRGGKIELDIGTAGSVTLVLQAVMPVLPFLPEPVEIIVRGGTDVPWSPTIDYVRFIVVPLLRFMGLELNVELLKRGHYPRGGGLVRYAVREPPGELRGLTLEERGRVFAVRGLSHAVLLPEHVARRQAFSAEEYLRSRLGGVDVDIRIEHAPSGALGPGSGITLWAECEKSLLGSDSLGQKSKRAELVGEEAATKLLEDLLTGAALDRYMSDMIIPLLALAKGVSVVRGARYTLHAQTNVEIVRILLGDEVEIRVEGEAERPFKLMVKGSSNIRRS